MDDIEREQLAAPGYIGVDWIIRCTSAGGTEGE